jgi:putative MATE family efflux protein
VEEQKKSLKGDLTVGNPSKLLIHFAIPMLIGNFFQQLYTLVDSIVVGKFVSDNALAAVGSVWSVNFLIISLTMGLAAGIGIIISQFFGAKDYENVKKSFATATFLLFIISAIMGTLGAIFSYQLLELLNTPATIIDDANIYLKILCIGIIGNAGYNGMAAVMRALGDSKTPLIFLSIACIVNIILVLLFVAVFHWGVAGAGIATIIAQAVAAIGSITYGLKTIPLLRMPLSEFRIDKQIMKKCIKLGLPAALQNSFIAISTMAIQLVINRQGEIVVAAATAAQRIEQVVLMPGMSLGLSVASYTGQNIGAGRIDRVKQGFWSATKIIVIFSCIMMPLIYFFGGSVMRLFTDDPEIARIGTKAVHVTCMFYIPVGMIYVSRNLLSGAGDVKVPMIMGGSEVLTRVIFSNVLTAIPVIGYMGIWWATGLNWFITGLIGCLFYASGRWKNKSIVSRG